MSHPDLTDPDAATAFVREQMPLCATLAIRAERIGPDGVVLALDHAPGVCTAGGLLHGGALMTLADSAGAVCAVVHLPDGATGTATSESGTRLLRGVTGGTVRATSTVLHAGRRALVIETELRDDDGRLVAKTTQTQAVLRR